MRPKNSESMAPQTIKNHETFVFALKANPFPNGRVKDKNKTCAVCVNTHSHWADCKADKNGMRFKPKRGNAKMSHWLHLKRTAEAKVRQRTRDESNKWENDARDTAVPR